MSEFPVALFFLFMLFFFPLVDLLGVATGAATACLIAHQTATRAATQQRFDAALAAVEQESNNFLGTGFAQFAKMKPVAGYNNCGTDVFIDAVNFRGGASTQYGPNVPMPTTVPVDPATFVYEYKSKVMVDVGPTVSLASVPWIGDVPGLGVPARLVFNWSRAAEYPEGLERVGNIASKSFGQMPSKFNAYPSIPWAEADNPSGSAWNYPGIYEMIKQQGQTVVNEDVLQIRADNPFWTKTALDVRPGDKVWIDYRADGSWSYASAGGGTLARIGMSSADGYPNTRNSYGFDNAAMLGRLGPGGSPFLLGKQKWNYTPPGSGNFYLVMNDDAGPIDPPTPASARSGYVNNPGLMTVRIIIAR